jgi:putative ABC transport system ATP-binding protein
VAGEKKKALSVQDLLHEFSKLRGGDEIADDKMLLI